MGTYQHRFTVFTPTYNRAYTIEKLYESLKRQTFRDFEWLVVDDGSTDDTQALFHRIQEENKDFPVRCILTENGGKHRAINRGVQEAAGELFFIVDSDDYLTDNALEAADRLEKSIPQEKRSQFAGVCGRRGYTPEKPIGTTFSGETLDITALQREAYRVTGDKAEVFYTEVMKKYPFPAFEGEKFVTECVVWNKMAEDGLLTRFAQEIMIVCNYLEDGLTSQGQQNLFIRNPRGYGLYLAQLFRTGVWPSRKKWEIYQDYYYRFRDKFTMSQLADNLQCGHVSFWLRIRTIQIWQLLHDRG